MPEPLHFPDGRSFAFSVIDDTDVATVDNVQPLYEMLEQLIRHKIRGCPRRAAPNRFHGCVTI